MVTLLFRDFGDDNGEAEREISPEVSITVSVVTVTFTHVRVGEAGDEIAHFDSERDVWVYDGKPYTDFEVVPS